MLKIQLNNCMIFAIMGNIYAKNIRGIQEPKVALLNIGTESKKGDEAHQQAYQLLQASDRLALCRKC